MKWVQKAIKLIRKWWYVAVAVVVGGGIVLGMALRNRKTSNLATEWLATQKDYYKEMADHAHNRASVREIRKEMQDAEKDFFEAKREIEVLNDRADNRRRVLWTRAYGKGSNN